MIKPISKKDKRGSIIDIFFLVVTLIGLAIFAVIIAYVIPQVTDGLEDTELNESAEVREAFNMADDVSTTKMNYVYLTLFAGLIISILISSFLIKSHPVFIPVYIFLLGFAVVVGNILNTAFDEFAQNEVLNSAATGQTIPMLISQHFMTIIIAIGVISMIIIFAKPGGNDRI